MKTIEYIQTDGRAALIVINKIIKVEDDDNFIILFLHDNIAAEINTELNPSLTFDIIKEYIKIYN